jgi:hypothetical protein
MRIRSFAQLTTADERTRRFTGLGFATAGMLTPEASADFQQSSIADANLVEAVPEGTRSSFERIRLFHSYGILCYDLFTLTDDLTWTVLEQALRERFVAFYSGEIPIVNKGGITQLFSATNFEVISQEFRSGGSHAKGWQLMADPTTNMTVPLTLTPLLRWARHVGLLDGQRNRRVQLSVFPDLRNHFAHGAGFRLGMPNESARSIHDLAEIINRLWGVTTPGGRIYPAPLDRAPVILAWSQEWADGKEGATFTELWPEQLAQHRVDGWTYLVVLAAANEHELREFDARYELTAYPTELLWGPGNREEAAAWLEGEMPVIGPVKYLDRLFAIRRDRLKVYLPCRPEILLVLPEESRTGEWDIVRADSPMDAFNHVRHLNRGEVCPEQDYGGCPIEEVAHGSWADAVKAATNEIPNLQPAKYSEARVPRHWPFPDDVGY